MNAERLAQMLTQIESRKATTGFNERIAQSAQLVREVLIRNPPYAEVKRRITIEYDARVFVRLVTGYLGELK